ncbi:glucosyltransferase domain-containing protein [Pseudomonas sp. CAM1A]|uniref:glucosyltransferase domain-containing protein n=1 Tax=Pseudomonas sp. CAM1A TaxID=3231717 RepID=UPI0039C63D46
MSAPLSWNRALTHSQVWLLCSAAMMLHILPLLMADHPFLDDFSRQHLASSGWVALGRPLTSLLYSGLGFASGAVNIYPLPLLMAVVISGYALAHLIRYWFTTPTFSSLFVVLPLWLQPFFLQNLSYQYDGAAMALSMAASVGAIALGVQRWRAWCGGTLLVLVAAGFYQVSINLFAGLCCIEVVRRIIDGSGVRQIWQLMWLRFSQLVVGCLLYYATCAWMIEGFYTSGLLPFDERWLGQVLQRLGTVTETVGLLMTPALQGLAIALVGVATWQLVIVLRRVQQRASSRVECVGLWMILLGMIVVALALIPGLVLFLERFQGEVRVMMGLGSVIVMLLLFVHGALARAPRMQLLVLAVPLVFMLSFSFAYGRVMVLQKALHQSVSQGLVRDLAPYADLAPFKHVYLIDFWLKKPWIPGAEGTLRAMPAVSALFPNSYLVLPEMLPLVGIDDFRLFFDKPPLSRRQVMAISPLALVRSQFYDIHQVGNDAYVLMKAPAGFEEVAP